VVAVAATLAVRLALGLGGLRLGGERLLALIQLGTLSVERLEAGVKLRLLLLLCLIRSYSSWEFASNVSPSERGISRFGSSG
jgi:hypothetical protein